MDSETIALIIFLLTPWLTIAILSVYIVVLKKRLKRHTATIQKQSSKIEHLEQLKEIKDATAQAEKIISSAQEATTKKTENQPKETSIQSHESVKRTSEQAIIEAIENKETIEVKYHGGSIPGAKRQIQPISMTNEKLSAKCVSSNRVKDFFISKIEVVSTDIKPFASQKQDGQLFEVANINDVFNLTKDTLESFGWIIRANSEDLSVHERFKNGKMKKAPIIALSYERYLVSDSLEHAESPEPKLKTKPWVLRAKGKTTTSFQNGSNAMDKLLDYANELAPLQVD